MATVSSKGQITIPSRARCAVGLKAHDRVPIEARGGEIVIRPTTSVTHWKGFLGQALSRAEERGAMARSVAAHARRRS